MPTRFATDTDQQLQWSLGEAANMTLDQMTPDEWEYQQELLLEAAARFRKYGNVPEDKAFNPKKRGV